MHSPSATSPVRTSCTNSIHIHCVHNYFFYTQGSRRISQATGFGLPVGSDLLTLADITECSRHLVAGEHDLQLLAIALDIKDEEYEHLKKTNSHPCGLAMHLLKLYKNQNRGTKEDLRRLLSSVKHNSVAVKQ